MGLLSGLSGLGLSNTQDIKVFESEKKPDEKASAPKKLEEKDYLMQKKFKCVVCDKDFTNLIVLSGKAKSIGSDDDLRPRFEGIDTIKYDIIMCPHCGFSSLKNTYRPLSSKQFKCVKEQLGESFVAPQYKDENTLTYEEAIIRYKMALFCTIVKLGKSSEKAYTCLKLAWILKSRLEEIEKKSEKTPEIEKEFISEINECYENAFVGFEQAFSKESLPLFGMDQSSLMYLLAQISKKIGKLDVSMRYTGLLITDKNVNERIKNKARDLKDEINNIVKAKKEAEEKVQQ